MSTENRNDAQQQELEKIDLIGALYELMGALRKFWIPVVILCLIFGAAGNFMARRSYVPMYKAYTSMVVSAGSGYEGSYYDTRTAEEMGSSFSYVATSGVLRDVVARNMGVGYISSQISAEVMEGTNIITIYVTDASPDTAYQVLEAVIASYPEITEYIVGPSSFNCVDDSGVPTEPTNRCRWPEYTFAGVFLALFISVLLLMIYSSRRKTIMNGEDLKELTNAKMLGNIPTVTMKKRSNERNNAILLDNDRIPSVFKECMRLIRSRLDKELNLRGVEKPVLLITSSIPGEGKSLFAANLAIAVAGRGKKVALVDGDLRNPTLVSTLGLEHGEGDMVRFLRNQCTEESMVVRYKDMPLTLYTGKTKAGNAIGLIRSREMRRFIQELKERFDFIIIDTPPSSMLSDVAGFESVCDGVVFVIRQDYTAGRQIQRALSTVTDASIPVIGYIMNGVMEGTTGFGYSSYGYSQAGYRKYGYGYGGKKGYSYGYGYGEKKDKEKKVEEKKGEETASAAETPGVEARREPAVIPAPEPENDIPEVSPAAEPETSDQEVLSLSDEDGSV